MRLPGSVACIQAMYVSGQCASMAAMQSSPASVCSAPKMPAGLASESTSGTLRAASASKETSEASAPSFERYSVPVLRR